MKTLRRIHLYLGCFFAPMLLFYVGTGWYQTLTLNRNKTPGEGGDWISRLRSVHVDQLYPTTAATRYTTGLYKILVVGMAIGLIVTIVLGVVMAFKIQRRKWLVWSSLAAGIILPIVLLWLGQHQ